MLTEYLCGRGVQGVRDPSKLSQGETEERLPSSRALMVSSTSHPPLEFSSYNHTCCCCQLGLYFTTLRNSLSFQITRTPVSWITVRWIHPRSSLLMLLPHSSWHSYVFVSILPTSFQMVVELLLAIAGARKDWLLCKRSGWDDFQSRRQADDIRADFRSRMVMYLFKPFFLRWLSRMSCDLLVSAQRIVCIACKRTDLDIASELCFCFLHLFT